MRTRHALSLQRRALLGAGVSGFLAGCATAPPTGNWISGRLVVRIAATDLQPARSEAVAFELRGGADEGELRLLTPLGTVVAAASWSTAGVMLDGAGQNRRFDSLDELSREMLGEVLPLRALPDWLAGKPWPGARHSAQPDGFEQAGWRVSTAALADRLLLAERAAAPAISLRVRLND